MPPTSKILDICFKNIRLLVSTHFRHFGVKHRFFGVWDYHQWIRIEIWSHIQVSCPKLNFQKPFQTKFHYFSAFLGARLGRAGPGHAEPNPAGLGRAGSGWAGMGRAGPGQARPGFVSLCRRIPSNSVEIGTDWILLFIILEQYRI